MQYIIAGQFAISPGSYDSNLGSEILILGGDIRSRSWPNIGDSYGIDFVYIGPVLGNLDPYSGTWTRTRELPVLVYVLKLPSTGDKKR